MPESISFSPILFPGDPMDLSMVGGKAFSLHEFKTLNVPGWFVVTPAVFEQSGCSTTPPESWHLDEKSLLKLNQALDHFSNNYFAVRSSSADEDGKEFSFAGQFESFLGVSKDQIPQKIVQVWRSGFSDHIKAYRKEHNLGPCVPPAVIVQKMVAADCAGVAFSIDPIKGYWGHALVSSVWGLGNALVDGQVDADTWRINRSGRVIEKQAGTKNFGYYLKHGMARKENHDAQKAGLWSLCDEKAVKVAGLARLCSKIKGAPQDIEWAFENETLYLLQSRPITNLGQIADPEGKINIWDNSNIAESYGGVTTPLTYSFARSIYEQVYRQFCKIMGVPQSVIKANQETFRGLLGLFNGRMYYNLINWYRLLACFPGFSVNQGFMEQMMGVKKELGQELSQLIERKNGPGILSVFYLLKALAGMGISYMFIAFKIKRFYKRLDKALAKPAIPLEQQRTDELVSYYRELENQLLLKWDAPLINDFFAMIFFGVLSKLCKSWCNDESLQNDLVGGSGNVISAEPAKRVKALAALLHGDDEAVTLFQKGSLTQITAYLESNKEISALYESYLEKFGDRCVDELKLESITLHENPLPLLRAIGHFAGRDKEPEQNPAVHARDKAQTKAFKAVQESRVKKWVFRFILAQARARVEDRENLRFERTRLFGRVRQIMVETGKRFAALKIIDECSDIFYLEKDEILMFVEGFACCPDLKGIANIRKVHFKKYKAMPPAADRFQTRGMVFCGNDFSLSDETEADHELAQDERQGIGCCPGIVKGKVRVVRDPAGVELPAGTILVAERTDPGWIMLFPAARGLLVEKGSLLSHSAIVARELGLPAVVSIPQVTTWLKDGDEVEFNGSTGKVKLLNHETD